VITTRAKQPSAMWRSTLGALLVAVCAGLSADLSASAKAAAAIEHELRLGLLAEPTTLDPHFHNLTPNDSALSHIYERLIHVDDKSALVPGLAESWTSVNDLTWTFKLRTGVTWHDGRAFTADDVVFSFERAASVPNSPSGFASAIKGKTVRKIDDLSVEITTPAADPLLLHQVTRIMIVPRSTARAVKTEDFNSTKAAIGTGPFRVAEYTPGKHLILGRNDAYWGEKSKWERIVLQPIPDGQQRVAALAAGEVDLIEDVPTGDIARLKGEQTIEVVQAVTQRVIYLHLDQFRDTTPHITTRDGAAIPNPLLDKRVRTALSKAINRDAIVSRVMGGAAIPASQFLADGFSGTAALLRPMAYDPEGAKKLLIDAGLPQGFKLTLHGTIGRYTNDVRVAEAIAQMFQRVGIETALVSLPASEFFARASSGDKGRPEFSIILAGRSTDTGEVSDSLNALVQTTNAATGAGAANRGRFSNTDVDTLIEAARATMDAKARAALLAQASVLAIAEGAIIPIYHPVRTWAMRKGLTYKARADEYTLATGVNGR
jgi:peptide/nickel transport system substrate-binding protein